MMMNWALHELLVLVLLMTDIRSARVSTFQVTWVLTNALKYYLELPVSAKINMYQNVF